MKKFVLTGATGSGKTTLMSAVQELVKLARLENVIGFGHEVARQLLEESPGIEHDVSFQDQLFAAQIKLEVQATQQGYRYLLCDRGSLDILVHAPLFGHPPKPEWLIHARNYDGFLVTNIDFPWVKTSLQAKIEHETGRTHDWESFRHQVHQRTLGILQANDLPYQVLSGDLSTRITTCLQFISAETQEDIEGKIRREKERR